MTKRSGQKRSPRQGVAMAAAAMCLGLALTSCGAMPRSGPVHKVAEPSAATEEKPAQFNPVSPAPDATAQEIVEGFLAAGVGAQDDFSVAREYLTPQLATTWRPDAQVLLHTGDVSTVPRLNDSEFRVSTEIDAEMDEHGVVEKLPRGTARTLDFKVTSVDGQWRISEAPDGVLIPRSDFERVFHSRTLYFFAANDPMTFVADPRWFVTRSTEATSVVRSMLEGPARYLGSTVSSALPEGTTLSKASVPVQGRTVTVELGIADFDPADVERGNKIYYQLQAALRQIPDVDTVDLRVNGAPVDAPTEDSVAPVTEVAVPDQQVGVSNGALAFYRGGQTEPVDNLSLPSQSHVYRPAMNRAKTTFAYLDSATAAAYTVKPGERPVSRWPDKHGTRPSFDNRGWVLGSGDDGVVYVADTESKAAGSRVKASWLADKKVSSLRVARDGTRVLVITHDATGNTATVWIAGITRDDTGKPQEIAQGLAVATDVDVDTSQWISNTEFVTTTLGDDVNARPRIYHVDGTYSELPVLQNATSLAGGNGRGEIYGAADGILYLLTGSTWARQSDRVTDTAFAG